MHAHLSSPNGVFACFRVTVKPNDWTADNVADRLRATTIDSATPVAEQEMQDSHSRLNNLDLFVYAHAAKTIQSQRVDLFG